MISAERRVPVAVPCTGIFARLQQPLHKRKKKNKAQMLHWKVLAALESEWLNSESNA